MNQITTTRLSLDNLGMWFYEEKHEFSYFNTTLKKWHFTPFTPQYKYASEILPCDKKKDEF